MAVSMKSMLNMPIGSSLRDDTTCTNNLGEGSRRIREMKKKIDDDLLNFCTLPRKKIYSICFEKLHTLINSVRLKIYTVLPQLGHMAVLGDTSVL